MLDDSNLASTQQVWQHMKEVSTCLPLHLKSPNHGYANEKYLTLSDGRTLAYEDSGDASSSLLFIFFHGVFGIGAVPQTLPPVCIEKKVHYITPTLAGWGLSSPRPSSKGYAAALASDMTELITHLHPDTSNLRIYISGGSYGSIPAQMLYGAPFDVFPLGRRIVGCLLAAPFSPFKWHVGYEKNMTWMNYISVGPPSRYIPFQLLQRLGIVGLSMKLSSVDKAEALVRQLLFDNTPPEEQEAFKRWRETKGIAEGAFEREMATNMVKSIKSWAGFIEIADVVHSDWGFCPNQLDEAHTSGRKVVIAASQGDDLGQDYPKWLKENYKNSTLKWVPGKHISTLYEMDNLLAELMEDEPLPVDSA